MPVYSTYLLGPWGNIGLILRGYRGFTDLTVFYFSVFLIEGSNKHGICL